MAWETRVATELLARGTPLAQAGASAQRTRSVCPKPFV